MYELRIAGAVFKRLKRLPAKVQGQVWRQIKGLRREPRPQDCLKLKAVEGYRITIGEYRALYTIDDQARIVAVYLLFHRGEGYPGKGSR